MTENSVGCFDEEGKINQNQFEPQAFKVLERMLAIVNQTGKHFIGAQYFLVGLAGASPWFQQCVHNIGLDPRQVLRSLEFGIGKGKPPEKPLTLERLSFSEHANLVLDEAFRLSNKAQPQPVNDRNLCIAFMKFPETNTQRIMQSTGLDLVIFQQEVEKDGPITIEIIGDTQAETNNDQKQLFIRDGELNLNLFDETTKDIMARAAVEAQLLGQLTINTGHLFLGMASRNESKLFQALRSQGLEPATICSALRKFLHKLPALQLTPGLDQKHISANVQHVLTHAEEIAKHEKTPGVITENCLLTGLLSLQDSTTLIVVRKMGIDLENLYKELGLEYPEMPQVVAPSNECEIASNSPQKTSPLELGRNLTNEARDGKLEPVYGRKNEIQRLLQTLVRQKKNNAILIGDAGVGKTAIVEGLAQRIADGKVPPQLKDKDIIEIPISSLVAGTTYRGQFEERLEKLIQEAQEKQCILFFDEIHTLVGAGQGAGGMLDGGNILKPALARGNLHLIGATTPGEYSRSIEKDAALDRRFQPIVVNELSADESLYILSELAKKYETFYNVRILPEAIHAAVSLSDKHLPNRQLPDKAIDLLEETCSKANLSLYTNTAGSFQALTDDQKVVVVTPEAVSKMLSQMTGTPIPGFLEDDSRRLVDLEDRLEKSVIGQAEAIKIVSSCIRVGRAGLRSQNRPIGVILFLGPSGVGKTWMASMVAKEVFNTEGMLFRLDMSEFSEQHSVSKLLGSPPGYVGYENEGLLTGHLRHHPSSVVLLDEIEKAHPVIFDTLLQVFDAGRVTDSQGRIANAENAIFIMTSNLAPKLTTHRMLGFIPSKPDSQDKKPVLDPEAARLGLSSFFRLEFLNRIDEIVVFNPLDTQSAQQIVAQRLEQVHQKAKDRGLDIRFTSGSVRAIVEKGFSQEFGARNLNRTIDTIVNQPLSELILSGAKGQYSCGVRSGQLVYRLIDKNEEPDPITGWKEETSGVEDD